MQSKPFNRFQKHNQCYPVDTKDRILDFYKSATPPLLSGGGWRAKKKQREAKEPIQFYDKPIEFWGGLDRGHSEKPMYHEDDNQAGLDVGTVCQIYRLYSTARYIIECDGV